LVERKFDSRQSESFSKLKLVSGKFFHYKKLNDDQTQTAVLRKLFFVGSDSQPQTRTEVKIVAAKKKAKKAGKKKK